MFHISKAVELRLLIMIKFGPQFTAAVIFSFVQASFAMLCVRRPKPTPQTQS